MKFCTKTFALFVVLFAGTASAQTVSTQPPDDGSNDTVTTTVNGQQVKVNRQTGRLVPPTAEEARILAEGLKNILSKSTEGLTVRKLADGTEEMDLQGRFMNLMLARTTTDGKIETECVSTPEAAADFFGFKLDEAAKDKDTKNAAPASTAPTPSATKTPSPATKTKRAPTRRTSRTRN